MRVLFCIHELALNGAVIALLQQARWLRARGHSVTLAVPAVESAAAALKPQFEAAGAEIAGRAVLAEYDVAVGCTVFASEQLRQAIGQIPLVWWIHEGRAGLQYIFSNTEAVRVFHQADALVFPSRGVAERIFTPLLSGRLNDRVEIIPAIVTPPAHAEPAPKPPGTLRVLCVGSVYPRKRQADLVRAVSMLRGAAIECVLAGEIIVPLDAETQSLIAAAPERFRLLGGLQPEALASVYRSADMFSLPSGDESMPLSPVEAALYGVPVVLSDLECYAGVWRHGYNALLHPIGDVELLAWSLRMLLESASLRQRLIAGARTTARYFSPERNGPLFEAVLANAIARRA